MNETVDERGLWRAPVVALAAAGCWLLPATLYGVIYVLFLGSAESSGFPDRVADACAFWALLGMAIVPIIAFGLTFQRSGGLPASLISTLVALIVYPLLAFAALFLVLAVDHNGVIHFS